MLSGRLFWTKINLLAPVNISVLRGTCEESVTAMKRRYSIECGVVLSSKQYRLLGMR